MDNITRIRQLHVEKKKSFKIMLIIELILIVLGVVSLFGKDSVFKYDLSMPNARVNFGEFSDEYDGVYADEDGKQIGNIVDFIDISLPRGTYRVQLEYATDTDMLNECYITSGSLSPKVVQTNGTTLYSGLDSTDFDMWLYRNAEDLIVHAEYNGDGMLAVKGLTIQQTNAMSRMYLFALICIITLVNCVYLYIEYDKEYRIPVKNKTITFGLIMTVIFSSIVIWGDYMIGGGDLGYHLQRVEGIKDGILAGQFPIRISPEWQQGYGYASPIFYGETVLYIAAVFRLIGFTVTDSCRIFMVLVTISTVLISYKCFKKIFNDEYVGLFCSLLYSVSIYRIYKSFYCGSWGECFGVMFLPIIVYGFYRVFTQDINEKSYKRSWLPLTIGFTMLIQSHLLTCEMVGFFTIILCLILWKRVLRKETFIVLAKTVIYSILLSAWFLVPFVDYMVTGDFIIQHVSARTIQSRGLFWAHLFMTYFISGDTILFEYEGMADSAATGLGMALVVQLFIMMYMFFTKKFDTLKKQDRTFVIIAGVFSAASMIMSLNVFPWNRIQAINAITATLVSSIQFPNRFLTIANVCLTAVAGMIAKWMIDEGKIGQRLWYFGSILLLVGIGNIYMINWQMNCLTPVRVYNNEGMGTGYISGAEYLPYGADASLFMYRDPVCTEGLEYSEYEKKSLGAVAYFENNTTNDGIVEFPLLYYKGYRAYDISTGRELECYSGENCVVSVCIPSGFKGKIQVGFVSPFYWRIGEIVTLLTTVTLLAVCIYDRLSNDKKIGEVGR